MLGRWWSYVWHTCCRVIPFRNSCNLFILSKYVFSLLSITSCFYLVTQSDTFLKTATNPVIQIQGIGETKCCINSERHRDVCGSSDCMWPCQFEPHEPFGEDRAFFHETSNANSLNVRQACAVESLALMNPNLTINLLMTGEIDFRTDTMQALSKYGNVRISRILLGEYFSSTPLEHWYFCTTWNYGPYAVSHLSDALRFLSLYKYGGYYFDLDVIMLQPVTKYRNFVAADVGFEHMAAGAIHVDYQSPIILMAVEEFRTSYKKHLWGYNGPMLLTRVMQKWCRVNDIAAMNTTNCRGYQVLRPSSFYPMSYLDWRKYFTEYSNLPDWSKDVIGVHVWNNLSAKRKVFKFSEQMYAQLAKSYCPLVFSMAPEIF